MHSHTDGLSRGGRSCVALALIGFAVVQLVFGDFIPGRAPAWPATLPGQAVIVPFVAVLFIAAGLAMLLDRGAHRAGLLSGLTVFGWAFVRLLPDLIARPGGIALTNAGKAFAITGGLLAVAGLRSANERPGALVQAGRIGLGAFMVIGSVQHVRFTQFVAMLIPAWLPARVALVYFAGAALLAGGVGMQVPRTRRLAALCSTAMLGSWIAIVHLPRALAATASADVQNEWTAFCEALAFAGTALIVAGTSSPRET